MTRLPLIALAIVVLAAPAIAGVVKEIVRASGPSVAKADAWRPYVKGFEREGEAYVCDNGTDAKARRGASQTIVLDQKVPQPIVASAWSKAEAVGGSADQDYSLYLDLTYQDGTPLWGQAAAFATGTHDWEKVEVRVLPAKPVKSVNFYLLMRGHSGKAWFRDGQLHVAEAPAGAAYFDGQAVRAKEKPGERWLVRDVAANSDFVAFEDGKALGLVLDANGSEGGLTDTTGKDRAVTLIHTMSVEGTGWRWLAGVREEVDAQGPQEYLDATWFKVGATGQLSRFPLAAVAKGKDGRAISLDMSRPAYFRVGYSPGCEELYIAFDVALTPEKPAAECRFAKLAFDGRLGLRGAVEKMYRAFPDQFRSRTPEQGLWMPFFAISKVKGWEDFGFKFKEGNDETAWDDAHGILTFRYTEPMTWWMPMPKEMPRTLEAALGEAKRLADKGNREALALLTSGYRNEQGQCPARLLDTPWCNGAVWSMNSAPGLLGDVTHFKNKWGPAIREPLYGKDRKGDLDGEYVDSSEGYVTDVLDFRRDHFAAMRTPLTFSYGSHKPAIFRGLIAWEYVHGIAEDVHGLGKLMMANGAPDRLPWLVPMLEVCGTETDWNPGGRWQPMSDGELMYRRMLCGPKPFCFLMNTDFAKFPHERVEKYMKRCLAYGMFPGFFSADASSGQYFSRPELYDRDRPLFKKYVPLTKKVAEAGWQPVPGAKSSHPKVYVERFGARYLTVFNDAGEKVTATISLEGTAPAKGRELVSGAEVEWKDGKATLDLGPEDVAVIDFKPDGT